VNWPARKEQMRGAADRRKCRKAGMRLISLAPYFPPSFFFPFSYSFASLTAIRRETNTGPFSLFSPPPLFFFFLPFLFFLYSDVLAPSGQKARAKVFSLLAEPKLKKKCKACGNVLSALPTSLFFFPFSFSSSCFVLFSCRSEVLYPDWRRRD